jgi:hypothetical protein
MTPTQIEAYVDATATTLQLPLDAAHRPGVLHYFALAAAMAELVNGLSLTVADEPAEAFTPIAPGGRSAHGAAQQQ